jgi:hypothetical protein
LSRTTTGGCFTFGRSGFVIEKQRSEVNTMTFRSTNFFINCLLCALLLGLGVTLDVRAQSVEATQTTAEEQNETFRDTLVRMRIKREEEEHKKLVAKAEQIKEHALALAKGPVGKQLPRDADKKLKEIEKNARNIRSDSGGGDDVPLEAPPHNLADALKQLSEASERLNEKLGKTSRHVVSLTVVAEATEIIQLVKLLRGYLH